MNLLSTILLSVTILTQHPITGQSNMSVLVQNMRTGEIIDSYRPDHVVPPASVMKLLTTGAALEMLGANYRFKTTLEYSAPIENGVLRGDLYINGTCDPSLGWKGKTGFLDQWVRAIREAGITRIEGAVIADMTLLDGDAVNPSWLCEDAGNYYAPGIFGRLYPRPRQSAYFCLFLRCGAAARKFSARCVAEVVGLSRIQRLSARCTGDIQRARHCRLRCQMQRLSQTTHCQTLQRGTGSNSR